MKLSVFRLLTAIGLIAFLQAHTFAADLRPALEAMARQDYDTLSRLIREQGLAQLLDALKKFFDGNDDPLISLVRPLAEQGHTASQYILAEFYRDTNNFIQAVKWYRPAALKGHTESQFRLGASYYSGIGVLPAKPVEGLAWINVAAAQGHKKASKLKSALVITTVLLTDADKQRVEQLTRQYWNEYVLPFQPTD